MRLVDEPAPERNPGVPKRVDGSLGFEDSSLLRRTVKRSNRDSRVLPLPVERLDEGVCRSTRGLATDGDDRVVPSVPIQLPILPVPRKLGLPLSEGCGNVLRENELDRSALKPGEILRELGALGLKLGAGA
jgi:hypothetical protein